MTLEYSSFIIPKFQYFNNNNIIFIFYIKNFETLNEY